MTDAPAPPAGQTDRSTPAPSGPANAPPTGGPAPAPQDSHGRHGSPPPSGPAAPPQVNSSVHDELKQLPQHRSMMRLALWIGIVVVVLLVAGAVYSIVMRNAQAGSLKESTAAHAQQHVTVVQAHRAQTREPLVLPGTLQGTIESPIYARSTGYVKRWNKDIGAKVKKGDVLAELDTPEVDQELAQTLAARQQTASSLALAKSSADRWESLRQKDAVTQQELDERRSAYVQGQANLAAADANVKRLQQLEAFKKITAPFDGVVTRRNVDIGDLIDAGGGSGRALFTVAKVDPLRIYLYVPQADAQRITIGEDVTVTQAELGSQTFQGKLVRSAGAIDTATRTLQVEVSLPNKDNKLLAGGYVQVSLPVVAPGNALLVPTNTLLFRAAGTQVAVVDDQGVVHLRPVQVGRDYGNSLELLSGADAGDKLILNPSDSLAENDRVVAALQPAPPASAASGGGSGTAGAGGNASRSASHASAAAAGGPASAADADRPSTGGPAASEGAVGRGAAR